MLLETRAFKKTAAGATFAVATPLTGDTNIVRDFNIDTEKAFIQDMWGLHTNTSGRVRIRSNNFGDQSQGLNELDLISRPAESLMPNGIGQPLKPNDNLIQELIGDVALTCFGAYTALYNNIEGLNGMFISSNQLRAQGGNMFPVSLALTLTNTEDYSGSRAVNADMPILNRTKKYALMGISVDNAALLIGINGTDIGKVRLSVPASVLKRSEMARYFVDLSDRWRTADNQPSAMIPVFNGTNQDNIFVDGVCDAASAGVRNCVLHFIELN